MSVTFRQGTPDDAHTAFVVFRRSVKEMARRIGALEPDAGHDEADIAALWTERRSLMEHLTRTAEHFWLAEQDGQIIGYARATWRDGVCELTEFFVLPGHQAAGVGKELLARAFPSDGARRRLIVATPDARAQTRYLKAGMYPQFPIYGVGRKPEAVRVPTDLTIEPVTADAGTVARLGEIDAAILGFRRDADHAWLLSDRQGYLYRRGGQPVGYGYVGGYSGPFALLDDSDFPAVLAHAESASAVRGDADFDLEVPSVNRVALQYLLSRGFRISPFIAFLMADAPPGRFSHYVVTGPPLFV